MAVRFVIVRAEARNDDVWFPAANCPDDVGENLVPIPDAQRFGGALRKTKIDGAGKELLGMIEASSGEKLLSADDAKALAQLGPDQVLPAVAARDRKVGSLVKRAVRPERHQVRVLVIRMRRDVEDAAEHIHLLERELNLGRVHWRRKTSRRRFDGAKRRCAHEQNAQRAANNFRTPISHERYIPTRL